MHLAATHASHPRLAAMHRSLRPSMPGFPVRRAADSWWAWFTREAAPPRGTPETAALVTAYAMPSEGSYSMLAGRGDSSSSSAMRRSMSSSVALSISDSRERGGSSGSGGGASGDSCAASDQATGESNAQSADDGSGADEEEPPVMMGEQLAPVWLIDFARRINPF